MAAGCQQLAGSSSAGSCYPHQTGGAAARERSPFFICKTGLVARLSPHRAVTMETRPWRAGATRPPIRPPPLMAAIAGHSRVMCAMCGPWGTAASSFFSMMNLAASFLRHQRHPKSRGWSPSRSLNRPRRYLRPCRQVSRYPNYERFSRCSPPRLRSRRQPFPCISLHFQGVRRVSKTRLPICLWLPVT